MTRRIPLDWEIYLVNNPDLCRHGILTEGACRRHFLSCGMTEGRSDKVPEDFDAIPYMQAFKLPDPRTAYLHYKHVGVYTGIPPKASRSNEMTEAYYDDLLSECIITSEEHPIVFVHVPSPPIHPALLSLIHIDSINTMPFSSIASQIHPCIITVDNPCDWITTTMRNHPLTPCFLLFLSYDHYQSFPKNLPVDLPKILYLPHQEVDFPTDLSMFHKVAFGSQTIRAQDSLGPVIYHFSDMLLDNKIIQQRNDQNVVLCMTPAHAQCFINDIFTPLHLNHGHIHLYILGEKPNNYTTPSSNIVWINPPNKYPWISQCDIFISYDMTHDVVKALSSGKAVVIRECFGGREFIRHEETGFVTADPIDMKNHIEHLILNKEERTRLGNNATVDAYERFSRRQFIQGFTNLFMPIQQS